MAHFSLAPTGLARANLAYGQLKPPAEGSSALSVDAGALPLARASYASEPLAVRAMIVAAVGVADGAERAKLAAQAAKLSRREQLGTTILFQDAVQQGDLPAAMRWLDRGSKTDRGMATQYVKLLVQAMPADEAVDALEPLLGAKPNWADAYWAAVLKAPSALGNAAELRGRLSRAPWQQRDVTRFDPRLVEALTAGGQYDRAVRLAADLAPSRLRRSATSSSSLLRDPALQFPNFLPPAGGWRFVSVSDFVAAPLQDGGASLSMLPDRSGVLIEQLVRLPAGRYGLGISGPNLASAAPGGLLDARLQCASDRKQVVSAKLRAVAGGSGLSAVLPQAITGCDWFLVQLAFNSIGLSQPVDLDIAGVALVPLGGRSLVAARVGPASDAAGDLQQPRN